MSEVLFDANWWLIEMSFYIDFHETQVQTCFSLGFSVSCQRLTSVGVAGVSLEWASFSFKPVAFELYWWYDRERRWRPWRRPWRRPWEKAIMLGSKEINIWAETRVCYHNYSHSYKCHGSNFNTYHSHTCPMAGKYALVITAKKVEKVQDWIVESCSEKQLWLRKNENNKKSSVFSCISFSTATTTSDL